MVVNRWLYRVCTGHWATYVRILPQLSRTAYCRSLERLSLEGSTGGGVTGSSCRCVTFWRFGAGPGCGGEPHCTVLLCRSRLSFRLNELLQTSQLKGLLGLQRVLVCLTKCARLVNVRQHDSHLCIVVAVVVAVVVVGGSSA